MYIFGLGRVGQAQDFALKWVTEWLREIGKSTIELFYVKRDEYFLICWFCSSKKDIQCLLPGMC